MLEPKSSRQYLDELLDVLTQSNVILDREKWTKPDCATALSVLKIEYLPAICGRSQEFQSIQGFAYNALQKQVPSHREPVNLVSGLPGCGKTRILHEAARSITERDPSVAVLACTLNGDNNAYLGETVEIALLRICPQFPVVLRLIHMYMSQRLNWETFASSVLGLMKTLDPNNWKYRYINICDVVDVIAEAHGFPKALLLIDEAFRWLGISTAERNESSLLYDCIGMAHNALEVNDKPYRAVIYSALTLNFLAQPSSGGGSRNVEHTNLSLLSEVDSKALTRAVLKDHLSYLQEYSGLTGDEVVKMLNGLTVGGLPRAAEFLHYAVTQSSDNALNTRSFGALFTLASRVYEKLAERYKVEWSLVKLAVSGVSEWPYKKVLPGVNYTAAQAVNRGILPEPETLELTMIPVFIPPPLIMASMRHRCAGETAEMREAAYYFSSIFEMSPVNLFEEIVVRTLILRSHFKLSREYIKDALPANASGDETTPEAVISDLFPTKMLSTLLDLFPGARGDLTRGPLFGNPMTMAWPLSNSGLMYEAERPPTPSHFSRRPQLLQHVFVSQSKNESGIDCLLILRNQDPASSLDASGRLIAVGVQCKWSDPGVSTELSVEEVEKACNNFQKKMISRGWEQSQLVFIVLAHRNLVGSTIGRLVARLPISVAVLGLKCGIETWLGPSLLRTVVCMHEARVSHGPYKLLPPDEEFIFGTDL